MHYKSERILSSTYSLMESIRAHFVLKTMPKPPLKVYHCAGCSLAHCSRAKAVTTAVKTLDFFDAVVVGDAAGPDLDSKHSKDKANRYERCCCCCVGGSTG